MNLQRKVTTRRDLLVLGGRVDLSAFPFGMRVIVRQVSHWSGAEVELTCFVPDRITGKTLKVVNCPTFAMGSTYEHALNAIMALCKSTVLHELEESFKFDGKRVFDPHKDEGTNEREEAQAATA